MKLCVDDNCNQSMYLQPESNFHTDKKSRDGLNVKCKECVCRNGAQSAKKIRDEKREKARQERIEERKARGET